MKNLFSKVLTFALVFVLALGAAVPLPLSAASSLTGERTVATAAEFLEALDRADVTTITLTRDIVLTESVRLGASRWGVAPPPRDVTLRGNHTIYLGDTVWGGFDLSNTIHLIIDGPTITNLPDRNMSSLIRVNAPARLTLRSGQIILTTRDVWATGSQGTTLGGGGSAVSLTGSNLSTGRGYFIMEGGAIYVNAMEAPRTRSTGVSINRLHTFIMNGGVIGIMGTLPDVALFDDAEGPLILDAWGPVERHNTSGVEVTMRITHRIHENETPGEFIMNGGLIAGARVGVNVNSDRDGSHATGAIFTMRGGEIGGNLIGMNVNSNRVTISGGSISNNALNIANDNNVSISVTSPTLNNAINVPAGLQAGYDPDWNALYQDIELTTFVRNLTNAEIARAGATTNVEKLQAIYNFVSMQFNHTYPQRTSSIRAARDGSRRPARESVPYPDGLSFIDSTALGGQGIISGSRRIPRNEDYIRGAWEMLFHLYAASDNYANLFEFMARSVGFEAMTFSGWFMPDNGNRFEHAWPKVRLDGNWYIFDVQREAFTNNTNSPTHNFFMQPVRETRVQDRYHLCQYCLDFLNAFPRIEGATIFTAGGSAAAAPQAPNHPSPWAAPQVNTAITAGLVPQNLQSNYTQPITRAEFAALAVALYENQHGIITGRSTFADTNDINVQKAAYIGVVTGVGDNRFNPNGQLTREQAAVMLARLANALGQPLPQSSPTFADNAQISSWAIDGVGQMQTTGIMGGVGDNRFAPQGDYTREQSIVTILRLFDIVQ